jgi:hypothetical protein
VSGIETPVTYIVTCLQKFISFGTQTSAGKANSSSEILWVQIAPTVVQEGQYLSPYREDAAG